MVKTPHSQRAMELVSEFPEHGNRTLANKLVKEFDGVISFEQARSTIRYHRGAIGERCRNQTGHDKPDEPVRAKVPFMAMPEPKHELPDWSFRKLTARRALILSDVHIPYFDKVALNLALDKGEEEGCDAIVLNGDFMDFFSVSRWQKDPRNRDFKGEIEMGRDMLQYLRERFKGVQIWWKLGNHEERWESWMWTKAPEITGVDVFEIEHFMHCAKYNVKVIRNREPIVINHLKVIHGHEYTFAISNPVNPARGLYMRAKAPAMMGHLHQTSEHTETNINGTICTCWSSGCLCDLRPSYAVLNKWNHGFATVDTTGEDDFTVKNYRIWNGRIL